MERALIALIVLWAVVQALRSLLPLSARATIARRLTGRLPDRLIIWFAGQKACEGCGGRVPPVRSQRSQ